MGFSVSHKENTAARCYASGEDVCAVGVEKIAKLEVVVG